MIIKKAEFLKSAADSSGFLKTEKPMIAVCGKSNVGKSTFINMLANMKKLAKTSSTPGRTRLVNYFDFGEFILADLPGYGFAEVSKAEKEKWAKTLDDFFAEKENITHVFSLVDSRHSPTADDLVMIRFLNYHIIPFTVIATKSDKLSKSRVKPQIRSIASELALGEDNIIAVSAETKRGKDEVLEKIESVIKLSNLAKNSYDNCDENN